VWVTGGVPVTRLKKMILEELQLRNYAQNTMRHYFRAVEDFAKRFRCSPDRLGPRHMFIAVAIGVALSIAARTVMRRFGI
jgi:hypothetical protein